MKFVHIADMHFDMPFTVLAKNGLAEQRRLDQRNAFNKMINYIKENNIEYLFISGDLYENEYVRKATIEYINNCFKQIPNTKIFITPGNHDPYISNSYYSKFEWNENVHIFTQIDKIEDKNVNIYGYGFTDFYSKKVELSTNLDTSKINILVMHADLDGATKEVGEYNPILESELKNTKFDYIALGHIHKNNFNENEKIIYPGSMMAGGFDELGKHGMLVGKINEQNEKVSLEFVELDNKEFVEKNLDISKIQSQEELIENINQIKIDENKYYKIILVGTKKLELNTNELIKHIQNKNIIKIKNKTKIEYDLEKISKEPSLKGIFVKELLEQINEENKEQILESIYIGLSLM